MSTEDQVKTYRVISPVDHDGESYAIGSSIILNETHATPLLAVKAIAEGDGTEVNGSPAATKVVAPTDPAERNTAIKVAISKLDAENKDLWTKDGAPQTTAITAVLQWDVTSGVTAAERNAAWKELNG